jgi:hypothetical protein
MLNTLEHKKRIKKSLNDKLMAVPRKMPIWEGFPTNENKKPQTQWMDTYNAPILWKLEEILQELKKMNSKR